MNIEEFREYAKSFNVIPVYRKLLADSETPLGVYRKLAKNAPWRQLMRNGRFLMNVGMLQCGITPRKLLQRYLPSPVLINE